MRYGKLLNREGCKYECKQLGFQIKHATSRHCFIVIQYRGIGLDSSVNGTSYQQQKTKSKRNDDDAAAYEFSAAKGPEHHPPEIQWPWSGR